MKIGANAAAPQSRTEEIWNWFHLGTQLFLCPIVNCRWLLSDCPHFFAQLFPILAFTLKRRKPGSPAGRPLLRLATKVKCHDKNTLIRLLDGNSGTGNGTMVR